MVEHVIAVKTVYGEPVAREAYDDGIRSGVLEWRMWKGKIIPVLRGERLPVLPLHGKKAWPRERYEMLWGVMRKIPCSFAPHMFGALRTWLPPSYDLRKAEATERMIERALRWIAEPKPYAPESTLFSALIRLTAYYQLAYGLLNERSMHVHITNRTRAQWETKGVWVRTWLYSLVALV